MNAHQRYVANTLASLKPAEVAALVACPPGNRSATLGVAAIHEMVTTYATDESKAEWADLLAKAAATPREKEWLATWSLPIFLMMKDLPVADEQDEQDNVTELDQQRQAA
jgi:hypothetical protein